MGRHITETTTHTTTKTRTVGIGDGQSECQPAPTDPPCPITDPDSDLIRVLSMLQIILRRMDRMALDQQRIERTVNRNGRKLDEALRVLRQLEHPPAPPVFVPHHAIVRHEAPQPEN